MNKIQDFEKLLKECFRLGIDYNKQDVYLPEELDKKMNFINGTGRNLVASAKNPNGPLDSRRLFS